MLRLLLSAMHARANSHPTSRPTSHLHRQICSETMGKMSSPRFQRKIRDNAKKFEFQAEVGLGYNRSPLWCGRHRATVAAALTKKLAEPES
jgi:hypothetical protein